MKTVTFELTDAQFYALELVARDVHDWCDNFITNRAREAIEERVNTEGWAQAIAGVAADGGDVSDKELVLIKAKELGLFQTLAEHEAAVLLEEQQGVADGGGQTDPLDLPLNQIQFFTLLEVAFDKTPDDVVEIIEQTIADKLQKVAAKNKFLRSTQYHRDNELFTLLAPALGIDDDQIDAAWLDALKIT